MDANSRITRVVAIIIIDTPGIRSMSLFNMGLVSLNCNADFRSDTFYIRFGIQTAKFSNHPIRGNPENLNQGCWEAKNYYQWTPKRVKTASSASILQVCRCSVLLYKEVSHRKQIACQHSSSSICMSIRRRSPNFGSAGPGVSKLKWVRNTHIPYTCHLSEFGCCRSKDMVVRMREFQQFWQALGPAPYVESIKNTLEFYYCCLSQKKARMMSISGDKKFYVSTHYQTDRQMGSQNSHINAASQNDQASGWIPRYDSTRPT